MDIQERIAVSEVFCIAVDFGLLRENTHYRRVLSLILYCRRERHTGKNSSIRSKPETEQPILRGAA